LILIALPCGVPSCDGVSYDDSVCLPLPLSFWLSIGLSPILLKCCQHLEAIASIRDYF
jgi:hypothetical protein